MKKEGYVLATLLESNGSVDIPDDIGRTALIYAAKKGWNNIVWFFFGVRGVTPPSIFMSSFTHNVWSLLNL